MEQEPIEIEALQVIGFAKGMDGISAYQNLLSENPQIQGTKFERIFYFQWDRENEETTRRRN